jgi:formate/nitrite transporter FocA (FNT family)
VLLEIAKPIALVLCLISLCAVFYTAFFVPTSDLEQRIWDSLVLLSLAAGICLASGLIFREEAHPPRNFTPTPLTRTLPVQMFCWATGLILILFAASWYLETYCIFYKDVRRF